MTFDFYGAVKCNVPERSACPTLLPGLELRQVAGSGFTSGERSMNEFLVVRIKSIYNTSVSKTSNHTSLWYERNPNSALQV